MPERKRISISVDPNIYEQANAVAKELGLTFSGAIDLFLRALIRQQGLPFDVNLKPPTRTEYAVVDLKKEI